MAPGQMKVVDTLPWSRSIHCSINRLICEAFTAQRLGIHMTIFKYPSLNTGKWVNLANLDGIKPYTPLEMLSFGLEIEIVQH